MVDLFLNTIRLKHPERVLFADKSTSLQAFLLGAVKKSCSNFGCKKWRLHTFFCVSQADIVAESSWFSRAMGCWKTTAGCLSLGYLNGNSSTLAVQNKAHGYRHQLGKMENDRLKKCENVREMMLLSFLGGCHNCKNSTYSLLWTMVSSYNNPTRSPPIDGGFSLE